MRGPARPIVKKLVLTFASCGMLLASCGGSDGAGDTTVAPVTTLVETSTTEPTDDTVRITVTVGVDSGPGRTETVPLGSSVEITLVNPGAEDNFHLHGYDIETGDVPSGTPASISFVASEAGSFEIESHLTEEVYVVIDVG